MCYANIEYKYQMMIAFSNTHYCYYNYLILILYFYFSPNTHTDPWWSDVCICVPIGGGRGCRSWILNSLFLWSENKNIEQIQLNIMVLSKTTIFSLLSIKVSNLLKPHLWHANVIQFLWYIRHDTALVRKYMNIFLIMS